MSSKLLNIVSDEKVTRGDACSFGSQGKALVKEEPAIVADKDFAGNVLLVTLGCAKNLVDSEVMLGVLKEKGFRAISDPENADLIVVNTCSFLESAVKEGIDRILELAKYKETARCRKLVVAGCMVERYREDLKKSLPEVDKFISTDELLKVADDEDTSEDALSESRRPYFIYDESMPRVRSTLGHTSFVKIAEGCDRPCAFCIIPKIRGSFRSRSINSVYSEISQLYSEGVKEINLVAQDLTSYGVDFADQSKKEPQLVQLLEKLSGITTDNLWLRLLYAYPIGVTERLIKTIENSPIVCNYLDLPLQHISNSVLKRMNRPLGERGTRGLIEQIRSIAPKIALRTTFVVGFPGETEEDIDILEKFIQEGHFTHVGIFSYSQESEAKSFNFPDQVAKKVGEERRARLMLAQQQLVQNRLHSLVGSELKVLIDGFHEDTDLLLTGRTQWQAPETDGEIIINNVSEDCIDFDREENNLQELIGKFAQVKITEVAGYDLVGEITEL